MTIIGSGKRTYYLVLSKSVTGWDVKITDNDKDYEVLTLIKADSYTKATEMVSFNKTVNGEMKFL